MGSKSLAVIALIIISFPLLSSEPSASGKVTVPSGALASWHILGWWDGFAAITCPRNERMI